MINPKNLESTILFSVGIDIWSTFVVVTYGDNEKFLKKSITSQKRWNKKQKKEMLKALKINLKDKKKSRASYMYQEKFQLHYIHIFEHSNLIELISHVSHEALHATFSILEEKGVTYTPESEEAYTYLQHYILGEIIKEILKL